MEFTVQHRVYKAKRDKEPIKENRIDTSTYRKGYILYNNVMLMKHIFKHNKGDLKAINGHKVLIY